MPIGPQITPTFGQNPLVSPPGLHPAEFGATAGIRFGQGPDVVHFGQKTDAQKVADERRRLRKEDYPSLRQAAFQMPQALLQSFRSPTPLLLCLPGIKNWFRQFRNCDQGFQNRALYNVTGNAHYLNQYLPYRALLSAKGDTAALVRYEKLVAALQEKIEFHQVDSLKGFDYKLNTLFMDEDYQREINEYAQKKGGKIDFNSDAEATGIILKHLARVNKDTLDKEIDKLEPLDDKSTRYYLAASLAELFMENPGYIDQVLNQAADTGDKHPLRFVVGGNAPLLAPATFRYRYNVIMVNRPSLWLPAGGTTYSQHEFIHAFSVKDGLPQGILPVMTGEQKERFEQAREELFAQFKKNDDHSFARFKFWLTGKTSTGVSHYAFFNQAEFLTTTLDQFKMDPQGLCKSKAGQEIYEVYQEVFGLDPLNDYNFKPPHNKPSTEPQASETEQVTSAQGKRLRKTA